MIAPYLIFEAALVAGLAVLVSAFSVRWPALESILAAIGASLLLVAWRVFANSLALNADFIPGVSIGDSGCLIAGSLVPYIVSRSFGAAGAQGWFPAIVGALVGFVINVAIL